MRNEKKECQRHDVNRKVSGSGRWSVNIILLMGGART